MSGMPNLKKKQKTFVSRARIETSPHSSDGRMPDLKIRGCGFDSLADQCNIY